jgi:hypothetical protein
MLTWLVLELHLSELVDHGTSGRGANLLDLGDDSGERSRTVGSDADVLLDGLPEI